MLAQLTQHSAAKHLQNHNSVRHLPLCSCSCYKNLSKHGYKSFWCRFHQTAGRVPTAVKPWHTGVKKRSKRGRGHLALPILSDHHGQDAESLLCLTPVLYTCSPSCKQNQIHYTRHCSAAAQDSSHEHFSRSSRPCQCHMRPHTHSQHTRLWGKSWPNG